MRIVAEHAHIWNGYGSPDEMRQKNQVLDEWCGKIGRNPQEIERSMIVNSMHAPEVLKHLDAYLDAGVTHFVYGAGMPFNLDPAKRMLEWRESRLSRR